MQTSTAPAASPLQPADKRLYFLYLLPILAFPVLLLLSAFFIIPSDWFVQRSGSTYLANFAYGETLRNRTCQILIYGDSTAMIDLSPAILTARTGLTACNIAEFEGMTLVTGTLLLDRFLARNPRPQYIVFLYAPENLSTGSNWIQVSTFEATSWIVRNDLNPHTAAILAIHPVSTFSWAEQGLRMALQRLRAKPFPPEVAQMRARANGQFQIPGGPVTGCDAVRHDVPPDAAWLQALRRKYAVEGTQVILDATPTAPCDASLAFFQQHLKGQVDDDPYMPTALSSFLNEGRLHANAVGAARISEMVANQINARKGANP
jgi:hypothetical protein